MNCANTIEHEQLLAPSATPVRQARPAAAVPVDAQSISAVQVFTLVMWLGLLTVGGLGFALPYMRPASPAPEPAPVQAQFLNVQLTTDELPDVSPAPSSPIQTPPPATEVLQPSTEEALLVAEPLPAIAFAIPVAAPARIVPAAQAGSASSKNEAANRALPPAQTLTFGRGEGKQPAPEYPLAARREGQEGSVRVRFTVGADGRVLNAETAGDCAWPMLNDSAVRTVSKRWRFIPGPVRLYEVIIHFKLSR